MLKIRFLLEEWIKWRFPTPPIPSFERKFLDIYNKIFNFQGPDCIKGFFKLPLCRSNHNMVTTKVKILP